ncbi:MAG: cytochrome c3 family protein [Vicinamibacterales bacterium]
MHRHLANLVVLLACALAVGVTGARVAAQEKAPPGVVILKGNPMGGVKFDHKKHSSANDCATCHHASKPEKPLTAEHQACQSCHTKTATAPMKTTARNAFHNPTAKAGVCIECHVATNTKMKNEAAPTKCAGCHQKANG